MSEVPTQSIETPDDQDIEAPALGVRDKSIKGGSSVLGAGHALVDVLRGLRPAAGCDVASELGQLVLGLLVERRDPCVDGRAHDGGHHRPPSDVPALRI